MQVRVITWNLFHGRDAPPDPALFTRRSRLFGVRERNQTHVQVNRDLYPEFARLLAGADWDIALLQECPPRWLPELAETCGADWQMSLTSRNRFGGVRARLARANPDLLGANEGGSNVTLVRQGEIAERRDLVIRRGRPERRTMAFARLLSGLAVANIHVTNDRPDLADDEIRLAADAAVTWAGEAPLVFGGDLNVRPGESGVYGELRERFGLTGPTGPDAIDHLLARGLRTVEPSRAWPPDARERSEDGLALRLSDHAPVEGVFEIPPSESSG